MATREEIVEALIVMYVRYGKTAIAEDPNQFEPIIDDWAEEFENLPIDMLKRAIKRHQRLPKEGAFLPRISDIYRQIDRIVRDEFEYRWAAVLQALKSGRYGPHKSIDFGDRRLHYAIEQIGGWIRLGEVQTVKLAETKKALLDAYLDSREIPVTIMPDHVVGIIEAVNGHAPIKRLDYREFKQAALAAATPALLCD